MTKKEKEKEAAELRKSVRKDIIRYAAADGCMPRRQRLKKAAGDLADSCARVAAECLLENDLRSARRCAKRYAIAREAERSLRDWREVKYLNELEYLNEIHANAAGKAA